MRRQGGFLGWLRIMRPRCGGGLSPCGRAGWSPAGGSLSKAVWVVGELIVDADRRRLRACFRPGQARGVGLPNRVRVGVTSGGGVGGDGAARGAAGARRRQWPQSAKGGLTGLFCSMSESNHRPGPSHASGPCSSLCQKVHSPLAMQESPAGASSRPEAASASANESYPRRCRSVC
jgi:hypothetical protein